MHDYDTLANWLREQAADHAAREANFKADYQRGFEAGMAAAYRIMLAKTEATTPHPKTTPRRARRR